MARLLLALLALLLLASGCPGTAAPGTRTRRDAGSSLAPDGYIAWPNAPEPEAGGITPANDWGTPPAQSDTGPAPTPPCTPIDGVCGGANPACCTGGHCVDFPNVGPKCAKICTANAECPATNCCVGTSQGVSVCGPSSYCPQNNPPPDPTPTPTPTPTPPPSGNSCQGSCGKQAPGGCWCDYLCVINGDCCPDVFLCLF